MPSEPTPQKISDVPTNLHLPGPSKPHLMNPNPPNPSKPPFHLFIHWTFGVFTSPNATVPQPFPLDEAFSSLESTQSPCYADDWYPFLVMVPTSPQFNDLLFGDLQLKPGQVFDVEKQENGEWQLTADMVAAWNVIKQRLLFILNCLQPLCPLRHLNEVLSPPTPTKFGYQRSHKLSGAALVTTKHSHLTFCVLMGQILFLIAYSGEKSKHDYKHRWEVELCCQNPPISHDIINLIRNSKLNNFSSEYSWAGVILHPSFKNLRCAYMPIICNVPVWIFWGIKSFSEVNYSVYLSLDKYKPQPEHVKNQFEQLRLCKAPLQKSIPPGLPIPQEGSGQFMGELPWEYLERRALEIANYLQTADEQEWEIIFSKSLVQVSHLLPTCPGPTVWIWENDPNGFPVKCSLNWTQSVRLFWKYRNSQQQYDPQRDQWDIFQFHIPKKLPHYNNFPHASEPLLLDTNQPSSFDEFSFDMFKNSPHADFGLESMDTYDDIELETTDNHIV